MLDGHVDLEGDARDKHAALLEELGIGKEETREARPPTEFEIKGAAGRRRPITAASPATCASSTATSGLVIGAGGGSLTLFDAIRKHGGRPANYCEIGGNPSVKKACELTKLILSKPGVKKIAVMMNVVSNTRVDIVARGVIKGCVESGRKPAETIAIFRIPGAWEDDGFKILRKYGVEYCDRTVSMYEAAGPGGREDAGVAARRSHAHRPDQNCGPVQGPPPQTSSTAPSGCQNVSFSSRTAGMFGVSSCGSWPSRGGGCRRGDEGEPVSQRK